MVKSRNKNKKLIIFGIIAVVALLGIGIFVFAKDDNKTAETPSEQSQETQTQEETKNQDEEEPGSYTQEEEPDPEEPKTSVTPPPVKDRPVVYTGYGHAQNDPLKSGQVTSTSCTTDAKVDCKITFTNKSSGAVITFDTKKTNNQGVALWEWTGGSDVPAGTWKVIAMAGNNQKSPEEIIYIK